tara:strand:- start:324 stop:542 length:219 start_codon:yes stop_codon:yes gene_type:complete
MPTDIEMQMFELSFSSEDTQDITFSFTNVPKVTVTSNEDVNIYINNLTNAGCTVNTSAKMTGTVYVQLMGYV